MSSAVAAMIGFGCGGSSEEVGDLVMDGEEALRLPGRLEAALREGRADAAALEAWLVRHAVPEIRGEPVAERMLPRLKALADLAGALTRRSGAGMSRPPPALAAAAGRLGLIR